MGKKRHVLRGVCPFVINIVLPCTVNHGSHAERNKESYFRKCYSWGAGTVSNFASNESLITSFSVDRRLSQPRSFLQRFGHREALVLAPSACGGRIGSRYCSRRRCIRCAPLSRPIGDGAATKRLAAERKTILAGVAVDALAARAVHACPSVVNCAVRIRRKNPGLFRALASTLLECG